MLFFIILGRTKSAKRGGTSATIDDDDDDSQEAAATPRKRRKELPWAFEEDATIAEPDRTYDNPVMRKQKVKDILRDATTFTTLDQRIVPKIHDVYVFRDVDLTNKDTVQAMNRMDGYFMIDKSTGSTTSVNKGQLINRSFVTRVDPGVFSSDFRKEIKQIKGERDALMIYRGDLAYGVPNPNVRFPPGTEPPERQKDFTRNNLSGKPEKITQYLEKNPPQDPVPVEEDRDDLDVGASASSFRPSSTQGATQTPKERALPVEDEEVLNPDDAATLKRRLDDTNGFLDANR